MDSFKITNFGPINNVDIQLGDLTILLGPQASGKTGPLKKAWVCLAVDLEYSVHKEGEVRDTSYLSSEAFKLGVQRFGRCIGCSVDEVV